MLAKVVVLAALIAAVSASIPITSISLPHRIAAIQGSISNSECVPCEEAMSHAIHTAAEAGNLFSPFFCMFPLSALSQFISGWMGEWMFKICPYLNEKYATPRLPSI
jgi:hypothetical protein